MTPFRQQHERVDLAFEPGLSATVVQPDRATSAAHVEHQPASFSSVSRPGRNIRLPLLRGTVFVSLLLALACSLHYLITTGLRRVETSAFGAANRLVDGRINAEVVITGSSRALVHYDPRLIQAITGRTTYNLGRNGSQTDLQLAVLRTYLRHNAKPRLVVHNLDLFSFVTSHEIYDPVQYVPYLDEPAIYAAVSRTYPDAWKWKYLPLYGYVVPDLRLGWTVGLKRLAGVQPAEDHIAGFVPRALPWTGDFERLRETHSDGYLTPVEPQGLRDVEELIALCRMEGIPLILSYSPEYAAIFPLQKNRPVIFRLFQQLSARHGVPFWDFSDSPLGREQRNFYNSQHLNAEGAAQFSTEFAHRLAVFDFPPPTESRVVNNARNPAGL